MFERLYNLLLKLYPEHFRRAYGDEALRLVRDRARDEKGLLSGFRLCFDLLVDLAISLPREHAKEPGTPLPAIQPVSGDPSFLLLAKESLNPVLLFLAGIFAAASLWACVTVVAHSPTFPALFRDSLSLQGLVQTNLALARFPVADGAYSFCITAHRDIRHNAVQPLFTFDFAPPGASGVALIDGNIVKTFNNEQNLSIRADVSSGDHQFALHLDQPAENTSISGNRDFDYCAPK